MSLAACRFPRGRVPSKCIHLLIFKRGNVVCAWDSFLHHTADTPLPSIASPPLQKLDQTGHCHFSHGGDADRSCQKHVRTHGRKRAPAPTTAYPAPTHQTTRLSQNGSYAPCVSCKNGSNMETGAFHRRQYLICGVKRRPEWGHTPPSALCRRGPGRSSHARQSHAVSRVRCRLTDTAPDERFVTN